MGSKNSSSNAITFVIDKDDKDIANSTLRLSIVTCKLEYKATRPDYDPFNESVY